MTRSRDGTSVRRVIVFRRAANDIHMEEGRDVWWHRELEYVDANCPPTPLDSEHPLYILYTSGSTGKPKGILHTTGGYLVDVYSTTKYVFDIRDEDILLVHGRCGLGDRSQLRRLWAAREWRDQLSCTKAHRIGPSPIGFGESSRNTGSTFFTPRRRRSARSFAGATNG